MARQRAVAIATTRRLPVLQLTMETIRSSTAPEAAAWGIIMAAVTISLATIRPRRPRLVAALAIMARHRQVVIATVMAAVLARTADERGILGDFWTAIRLLLINSANVCVSWVYESVC